ncbi:2'-5' RNA ligase family protein [Thermomonospora umbrina]|uniref:2'-5' RNA ligase family protein n=1 Tax=Thermomonospora umbrina TaxID=111806 RepID=UPI000E259384|nr:2'-5' RNA ligase family protein [Thermomonospora umbrina]
MAIPIPDPYGAELQHWREAFGDPMAGSIPTHVTLLPPTEVDGDLLGRIDEHLRRVAEDGREFPIVLSGTATFRPVSPVVFVAIADGIGSCERVEARVRSGPLARELQFPYHPHVTVAHDLSEEILDRAFKELAHYRAEFTVWGFSLYEHGPDEVWRPLRNYPFGAGGAGPHQEGERPLG